MNPIYIGIDANEANVAQRVGSNQYAYEILKGIYFQSWEDKIKIYLRKKKQSDLPAVRDNWKYSSFGPSLAWTQWRLPLELYFAYPKPNIFLSLGHYAPRFSPIPTVICIMDLAYLKFPELFLPQDIKKLSNWTKYSVKQAVHIIAISENTKKDIISYYGIDKDRITVAYPGFDSSLSIRADDSDIQRVKIKYNLPKKYIIYLGTLQPRKNIIRLISAFEQLHPKFDNLGLVLAGKKGWMYEDIYQKINDSTKKNKIFTLDYVPQMDVSALYSGAETSCLLGLYEGFGMPAMEAISCGILPVVSNTGSLPEVVGKTGLTANPYSVEEIKTKLMEVLNMNQDEKCKRLSVCQKNIEKFSWYNSSHRIMEVLHGHAV